MITRDNIVELFGAAEIHVSMADLKDGEPLAMQGLDSLDMANLLFQIEQKFGLTISPNDASRLRTVQDMVDYVGSKRH
ncbi:phosphopantetheine-binding protein [Pendulispora brunnea]|uniref:Phosphopantetheine-binding protein n=1 Tax=Pendulispora brunnea TaxID=2905690 RepID=A0ABZ2KJV6_9BACT